MRINRLVILITLVGCKVATPTATSTYTEDLSVHRPVYSPSTDAADTSAIASETVNYVPLEGHIKAELDSIAKIAYEQNKAGRYVDGFVIQVYSGTSRDEANTARLKMDKLFPELSPKMSYHQPSFRVKGGRFTDRLEAHRIYNTVRADFPRALLIPERYLLTYE